MTAQSEPLETPSELDKILDNYIPPEFSESKRNMKAAIERLIAEARKDTLLFVRDNACLEDIKWIDKQLTNTESKDE